MEAIQEELISLFIVVITTCIGIITRYVVSYLNRKGIVSQIESHKKIVEIVVSAIEQTYKELDGDKKLELAKKKLVAYMQENKIKIGEEEIDLLIEAVVKEMNDAIAGEIGYAVGQDISLNGENLDLLENLDTRKIDDLSTRVDAGDLDTREY